MGIKRESKVSTIIPRDREIPGDIPCRICLNKARKTFLFSPGGIDIKRFVGLVEALTKDWPQSESFIREVSPDDPDMDRRSGVWFELVGPAACMHRNVFRK